MVFGVMFLSVFQAGCSMDETLEFKTQEDSEIIFSGVVGGPESLQTRANNNVYDITTQFYNCNFYIHESGFDLHENDKKNFSVYNIPSGYQGSLQAASGRDNLNWFSRTGDHCFRSWTMSWKDDYEPTLENSEEPVVVLFPGSHINETTNSSASIWTEDSWRNGECLEQFVGGMKGPIDYASNGQYVELRFRHLVSKVFLKAFAVVDNESGTSTTGLKGLITIYGLPPSATFYPASSDESGKELAPYVSIPEDWDYDPSNETTFAITNRSNYYYWEGNTTQSSARQFIDCFYFPPEIDFSRLSFKIEIYEYVANEGWRLSTSHGNHGAYFGDFKRVKFSRTTNGSNYDQGNDATILHAGEYLALSINLYEKGTPAVKGSIYSWSGWSERDASQHMEDGIFSIEEAKEFSELMSSSNLTEEKKQRRDEFFKTHGAGTTADDPEGYPEYKEEKKIIKLYEDIGSEAATNGSSDTKMYSPFYVADDYILDGQGHTINCNSASMQIGPMRDVYLRYYSYSTTTNPYTYTEYIVYIDKMGNVYLVDPETYEETPTGQNVNDAKKNPFTLSLSTGKIS